MKQIKQNLLAVPHSRLQEERFEEHTAGAKCAY